jgi:hypothetical protein
VLQLFNYQMRLYHYQLQSKEGARSYFCIALPLKNLIKV